MTERITLNILADSRPGLLHILSGVIEKKLIRITSLCLTAPEADGTVQIIVELLIKLTDLNTLKLKLQNIVEVYSVTICEAEPVPSAI